MTNFKKTFYSDFLEIRIGDQVERSNPGDYTDGRIGEVLALDPIKKRVRVAWDVSRDLSRTNQRTKTMRTWVTFKELKKIETIVSQIRSKKFQSLNFFL